MWILDDSRRKICNAKNFHKIYAQENDIIIDYGGHKELLGRYPNQNEAWTVFQLILTWLSYPEGNKEFDMPHAGEVFGRYAGERN